MANKLTATELDFDDIKTNLKTFLKSQSEFTDYNFEGSGLSVLMDLLAYNTHYMAMNANMAINEAFLDTATLRSSVVSHAKTLGYTPRSCRAPIAYMDILINERNASYVLMPKGTKFTTQVNGTAYSFVTIEDYSATSVNGVLRMSNIPVYEGTLVTSKYTVDSKFPEKRFLINSDRADTTTLRVSVQTSSSDSTVETYTLATDISQVSSTSYSYFLQEVEDGKFEVYFGDGVVGRALSDGNIVILEYIVTNKTKANGASSFSAATIGGYVSYTLTNLVPAKGGDEPEGIASIKYNAPLNFAANGRAVTADDYKLLIPKVYPDIRAVQVWGGEDNDPPIYGQVFLSVKTKSGVNLTQAQKEVISREMDKYNVASVRPSIIDPKITKLRLTVNFKYDGNSTTKTAGDLETLVRNSIVNYNKTDLEQFDVVYRHSKVGKLIDNSDQSILSNMTTVRMVNSVTPVLNTAAQYEIKFNNEIHYPLKAMISYPRPLSHPGGVEVVTTTGFTVAGYTETMYIEDSGNGYLRMYYLVGGTTKNYVNNNVGSVNYSTGLVVLDSLEITGTVNTDGTISIIAKPESNDVVSVRNQLLELDLVNLKIIGSNDTIEAGGSSAGTNYSTSSAY